MSEIERLDLVEKMYNKYVEWNELVRQYNEIWSSEGKRSLCRPSTTKE